MTLMFIHWTCIVQISERSTEGIIQTSQYVSNSNVYCDTSTRNAHFYGCKRNI